MASTSCASQLTNVRAAGRSWLLSAEKVKTVLPMRRREGFKPQATMTAAGPTGLSPEASSVYKPLIHCLAPAGEDEQEKRDPITDENVEEWIKDSVTEIVKNIGEAPFLVQIFSKGERNEGVRVEREAATPEAWPQIQKRWSGRKKKSQPPPDGIILVNELREDLGVVEGRETDHLKEAESSQVWGLLVQGRGMECVACYILNTCRVFSPAGCCTHFYVVRAQCFGDPVEVQMRNAWLQPESRSLL